jgi:hypothetical protein
LATNTTNDQHDQRPTTNTTNDQHDQRPTRPTTNDQRPTTNDQRPTTNDQRPTTNDQRPTTNTTNVAEIKTAATWTRFTSTFAIAFDCLLEIEMLSGKLVNMEFGCATYGLWVCFVRRRSMSMSMQVIATVGAAVGQVQGGLQLRAGDTLRT